MKRLILVLVLTAFATGAHAAIVTYRVEGDIYQTTVGSGQPDPANIDGAHFAWDITVDTNTAPGFVQGDRATYYHYVASEVTFSNRPNGLSDLTTSIVNSGPTLVTINSTDPLNTDVFQVVYNWNVPALSLRTGFFELDFASSFYSGSGPASLPEQIDFNDVISAVATDWNYYVYPGGRYTPMNWSINTAPIPIPATAWLFASALGLLGWVKRKRA